MDDHEFYAWRAEEELKHAAGADLLAHIRARAEAEEARTRQLLELLTAGFAEEQDDDNPDLDKEAA